MSHRRERVAHEIHTRLSAILEQRVGDPRLSSVTLTAVEISPDFGFARVFYRTLGEREQVAEALERAKSFIRRSLGEGLHLRRVPELDFRLDESLDRAARIEQILDELKEEPK